MSQKAIEIKNVSKTFGSYNALKNVSLSVNHGEFFSLLGPSGCGKTTLLRMIAGFEFPDQGEVLVGGKDMTGVGPHKRPVNMVFQSYALFPHLTVFENIAFGLRLAKVERSEVEERVTRALALVRLPQLRDRTPRELSGGQQQRIALARAFVNKPAVLLLDEPLSALDPKIRHEMQAELARFKRELDMTFVMVTHDQTEAFGLSDRIAVMNVGRIEQLGTAEEIFANPKTGFVADFIGQTNIFKGEIIERDGNLGLVRIGSGINVWATADDALAVGSVVTVWFRTQSVNIANQAPEPDRKVNSLVAEVLQRSFQGMSCDYRLKLAEDLWVMATIQSCDANHAVGSQRHVILPVAETRIIAETSEPAAAPIAMH